MRNVLGFVFVVCLCLVVVAAGCRKAPPEDRTPPAVDTLRSYGTLQLRRH